MMMRTKSTARLGLILLIIALLLPSVLASPNQKVVYVAKFEGVITSYSVDQFSRYIETAERNNAEALIIEIDTPGGNGQAMQEIIQRIKESKVPVIIYVYPPGAIAASAGTYIALGSHLIAMAPSTSIGACEPILGYSSNGSIVKAPEKIRNFYIAYIKSLAEESGRNVTAAEKFITEDLSLTPEEALRANVIELVANDVSDLLKKANGMKTKIPVKGKGYVTLNFTDVKIVEIGPSFKDVIVQYISDPTVAYILINIGMLGLIFGFLTPGWHVPETVGAILLVLGIIGLGYFGYNAAGLILLILAILFFIAEALTPTFGLFTVAGAVTMILGGILLFGGGNEYLIQRSTFSTLRLVIIVIAVLLALFFAFGVSAVIRDRRRKAQTGKEELIGEVGQVVQELNPEGMIRIRGELWRAESKTGERIGVGEKVRVVEVRGLTLIVVREGEHPDEKKEV
ncbi:nodulation protein NfeD [Thermococcus guaymasensis DSM 11113]|uniref:Nodulation protein NfeD n=2 Tax=Thermococcus guaymasensis TaxID=110164 RepID=A0A0X1KIN5_9EURY|nr:nodulation protein NfeD [Thermococcus guaymasensis]AJC71129.1 nodulation protein NfeD [Thermococcus guaymasensis DSM 11113]